MKIFTQNISVMPRRREGSPRCGQLCLGKPEDNEDINSGPPKRCVANLGEPLRLGVLAIVQGLCSWPFSGRSYGPVWDYCGLLRGPLCDWFERVIS